MHKLNKCGVMLVLIVTACLLTAFDVLGISYNHKISIVDMIFEWSIEGNTMNIRLTGKTKGWVGIGFNPDIKMKGANFILGYVKGGEAKFHDGFGIRMLEHISDELNNGQSDISNTGGSESGDTTTVFFTIPLKTSDPNDKPISLEEKTTVLLGFGPDRDNFYSRHKFRTIIQVDLQTGEYNSLF